MRLIHRRHSDWELEVLDTPDTALVLTRLMDPAGYRFLSEQIDRGMSTPSSLHDLLTRAIFWLRDGEEVVVEYNSVDTFRIHIRVEALDEVAHQFVAQVGDRQVIRATISDLINAAFALVILSTELGLKNEPLPRQSI